MKNPSFNLEELRAAFGSDAVLGLEISQAEANLSFGDVTEVTRNNYVNYEFPVTMPTIDGITVRSVRVSPFSGQGNLVAVSHLKLNAGINVPIRLVLGPDDKPFGSLPQESWIKKENGKTVWTEAREGEERLPALERRGALFFDEMKLMTLFQNIGLRAFDHALAHANAQKAAKAAAQAEASAPAEGEPVAAGASEDPWA